MHLSRLAAGLFIATLAGEAGHAAAATGPTCDAVQSTFSTGSFDNREAIVDALQDHLKAAHANKPLGRDGKVQAIIMAVMRCKELGAGDFTAALDRTVAQVERERARHRSDD